MDIYTGGKDMTNRVRYTRQNILTYSYYQLPKFLFDDEFTNLSNDAIVLYALLRNRHDISIKNGWYDKNGDVFLYFKREDMQKMLRLSENTVKKAMNILKKHCLLEEIRQGSSKPNKIYLLATLVQPSGIEAVETLENNVNLNNCGSRTAKNAGHEPQKLRVMNYNNNIYNNINTERVSEIQNLPAPAIAYGEYQRVWLTDTEYQKLKSKYGEVKSLDYINQLDRRIASTGEEPKGSYCATIEIWIQRDEKMTNVNLKSSSVKKNRFNNFESRELNYEEIERMERQYLIDSLNAADFNG